MIEMHEGFARYGFRQGMRRLFDRPIDPLARPAEIDVFTAEQYVCVKTIDKAITAALGQKQPACFLVAGPNGTGRTSAANCILARYVEHLRIKPEHLMVPRLVIPDHNEIGAFKKWMTALRSLVRQQKLNLPPELAQEFDLDRLTKVDRDTLGPAYQDLIARLLDVAETTPQRRAIACCLEDVPTFKFISQATEVFADIATVCVFTTGDYSQLREEVIQPFREKLTSDRHELIQLKPVVGRDALSLVDARWRMETAVPNPFDAAGIENAFAGMARPIARIMLLLERMLAYKTHLHGRGPIYNGPQDDLHFRPNEIFALLKAVDN